MKAAIGLAPGNIENRSIEEPASRQEFRQDKEIVTSSHLPVSAPVTEAEEADECYINIYIYIIDQCYKITSLKVCVYRHIKNCKYYNVYHMRMNTDVVYLICRNLKRPYKRLH